MKKFVITEEEKKQILGLYEQVASVMYNTTNDQAYDYKFENNKYYFKGKPGTKYARNYPDWKEVKVQNVIDKIKAVKGGFTETTYNETPKVDVPQKPVGENKVEIYGSNSNIGIHWLFPSLSGKQNITYNLSIKCNTNCLSGTYSLDKKNLTTTDMGLDLLSFQDQWKYRNFTITVQAVEDGKVVATTQKIFDKSFGQFTGAVDVKKTF